MPKKIEKLTPEALRDDKVFVAAMAQATMAAMRWRCTRP